MSNRDVSIAQRYINAVVERARNLINPEGFQPDWEDQPLRHKVYQDVEQFPLTNVIPSGIAPIAEVFRRSADPPLGSDVGGLGFSELSVILRLAHGVLQRRIRMNWNVGNEQQVHFSRALYSRGTPSGGGLYPTEIYWCCGPSGPMLSGVYHYDTAHHAMQRLCVGDVIPDIRRALLHHPLGVDTNQYFLVALNFWKTSFKYSAFSYHVVTQDLGCLLCSLRLVSLAFGTDLPFLLWFNDEDMNRIIGLETALESVFAVIPIPVKNGSSTAASWATPPATREPLIQATSYQRSKKVIRFDAVEEMHSSALVNGEPHPDLVEVALPDPKEPAGTGEIVELPNSDLRLMPRDLVEAVLERQSCFSRFSSSRRFSLDQLATMLKVTMSSVHYVADVKALDKAPPFTRLMVFVNRVEGLSSGTYLYHAAQHELEVVERQDLWVFLQSQYNLENYNLENAAAVIAIVGNPAVMLAAFGNRGIRILNAEVGYLIQATYLVASGMSAACGAALGFDNVTMNEKLGLAESAWKAINYVIIGPRQREEASFDGKLS